MDQLVDKSRPGDPCTFVVFGAQGDLTKRKLIPALYNLRGHGLLPRELAIMGFGRTSVTDDAFRKQLGSELRRFATMPVDEAAWSDFATRIYYTDGEFGDAGAYRKLAQRLREIDERHGTQGNVLFYLATPPQFFAEIVRQLGAAGLARESEGKWRRFIIEKPFGRDLTSALELNRDIKTVLSERQIYRIDHYLGKETVQNLMVLRLANGILEPVWNRRYIDHVQILVAESIGVEGRGGYYDNAGTLRDMIQNHMFQLLALVGMEPPTTLSARDVRDEKAKVLRAIKPMRPEQVRELTVRGQYAPGTVAGREVPGYRSEPNVAPASRTETFAALELSVDNWRWAGVPFYLRSGKRLPKRSTQIVVQFKRAPHQLFLHGGLDQLAPNRLVVNVQPEEGVSLQLQAKIPGPTIRLTPVNLDFDYSDFGDHPAGTGYETLLHDCMVDDSTLFHRSDMVEAAWEVATPILDAWAADDAEVATYAAGTWGPAPAHHLIERSGRHWINPE
jgi:glucose-6-phosphate 1-dehydrogenase